MIWRHLKHVKYCISWTSKTWPALLFGWNPWRPLSLKDISSDLRCSIWSIHVTATEDALEWRYQYWMSNDSNSNLHLTKTAGGYHDSILLRSFSDAMLFVMYGALQTILPVFQFTSLSSLMTLRPFIYTLVPSPTAGPTEGGKIELWHNVTSAFSAGVKRNKRNGVIR